MPFTLYVTCGRRLDEPGGLTEKDLDEVVELIGGTKRPSGVVRFPHPDEGHPWCVGWVNERGQIRLETSLGNRLFLACAVDLVDLGLRIAKIDDARVLDVDGKEWTPDNFDTEPEGELGRALTARWDAFRKSLTAEYKLPFEYPRAGFDGADDFFRFHLMVQAASLEPLLDGLGARVYGDVALLPSVRIYQYDDRVTIVGDWSSLPPFGATAKQVLAVAEELERRSGATLMFNWKPFPPSLRAQVRARLDGLGVDFYEWWPPPVVRLESADAAVVEEAVIALARDGFEADAVPALVAALGHASPDVRRGAIRALGVRAAPTPEVFAAVEALADDPVAVIRTLARQYARLLAKRANPRPSREPTGTPAERKRAKQLDARAHRHNWDNGVAPLRKIVADPDCDRGTALRIYWMGRPEWYCQYADRSSLAPYDNVEIWDLLADIEQKMAAGFYAHANIAFDPACDEDDEGYSWVGCYDDKPKVRALPPLMYQPV